MRFPACRHLADSLAGSGKIGRKYPRSCYERQDRSCHERYERFRVISMADCARPRPCEAAPLGRRAEAHAPKDGSPCREGFICKNKKIQSAVANEPQLRALEARAQLFGARGFELLAVESLAIAGGGSNFLRLTEPRSKISLRYDFERSYCSARGACRSTPATPQRPFVPGLRPRL